MAAGGRGRPADVRDRAGRDLGEPSNGYVQTYQGEDQHFQYDSFGNYVSTTIPPLTNLRFAGELVDRLRCCGRFPQARRQSGLLCAKPRRQGRLLRFSRPPDSPGGRAGGGTRAAGLSALPEREADSSCPPTGE